MRLFALLVLSLLVPVLVAGCVAPTRAPQDVVELPVEAAPPAEPTILPGQTSAFIPRGPADQALTAARVVAVDIQGSITVESSRGPTDAWVTDALRYHFGDAVEISMSVRPGRLETLPGGPANVPAPRWDEPGDHAIVIGRILGVDPRGTITVDSPRGPIRVWVTQAPGRYRVGEIVEVRSRVRPGS